MVRKSLGHYKIIWQVGRAFAASLCLLNLIGMSTVANPARTPALADSSVQRMTWSIEGVTREATVHKPAKQTGLAPLVFAFHGHGGRMRGAARMFKLHEVWPEAIVVYAQGLQTPGKNDPEGEKSGWQKASGDQGDRDLKLYDAMLKTMIDEHRADPERVYATGHSNGGGFTYVLWSTRHHTLAAVAPSAGGGAGFDTTEPLPAMHFAGRRDRVAPFAAQQRVMEAARRVNLCNDLPKRLENGGLLYESDEGAPFVSVIHPGSHAYLDRAPAMTIWFFKQHQRKTADKTP